MTISLWMNGSRVHVRGEGAFLTADLEPFLDVIDEHIPIALGMWRCQQQGVIPTCVGARYSP